VDPIGRRGDRVCRAIGLAGVVLFLVTAFTPLAFRVNRWAAGSPALLASDAIVVLGGAVSPSGMLSQESSRRLTLGVQLYRRGLAPVVVLLGPGAADGPAEADVRAEQARLHGVPASAILTETRAQTTLEEAARVKALLEPRGVRTILLVTNAGHLLRARPLFERAGFEVRSAPSDTSFEADSPAARLLMMTGLVKELLGWLYYQFAGYI
jgi:uncharacterized SAM-binding protein YcdF (DUF218 family)